MTKKSLPYTPNTILFTIFSIFLCGYYTYWAFSTSAVYVSHDILYYIISKLKMDAGMLPSIDFPTPMGIFILSYYNFWHDIVPNSALIFTRLPFAVLFTFLAYKYLRKFHFSTVMVILFLFFYTTLYTHLWNAPGQSTNYYNDVLFACWFIGAILCTSAQRHIYHYVITAILAWFFIFFKINGAIMMGAFAIYMLIYDPNRIRHGAIFLGIILALFITTTNMYPNYLNHYWYDLSIASHSETKSTLKLLTIGISALIINNYKHSPPNFPVYSIQKWTETIICPIVFTPKCNSGWALPNIGRIGVFTIRRRDNYNTIFANNFTKHFPNSPKYYDIYASIWGKNAKNISHIYCSIRNFSKLCIFLKPVKTWFIANLPFE